MTHERRRAIRLAVGLFVPHTAVLGAQGLARRVRRGRAVAALGRAPGDRKVRRPFSYDEAEAVLSTRGVGLDVIRKGSIPAGSLRFATAAIAEHAPRRPLRALHIGNFLGVSLAALSDSVVTHDPASVVVSVDPNLTKLGVENPQDHAIALLDHFGLTSANVVLTGYSLERSAPDLAGEDVLVNLERLGQRFDIAFVDGLHDPAYVRRELEVIARVMTDGGLVVLDDVSHDWNDIRLLFKEVDADDAWPFEKVGHDRLRLGVLRRTARDAVPVSGASTDDRSGPAPVEAERRSELDR